MVFRAGVYVLVRKHRKFIYNLAHSRKFKHTIIPVSLWIELLPSFQSHLAGCSRLLYHTGEYLCLSAFCLQYTRYDLSLYS